MSKLRDKLLELCQFKLDEQRQAFEIQIAELQRQLNRFSNPWTVEIQNQASGRWEGLAHDAPLTLGDAEQREAEHRTESPRAKFRVVPWLNNSQRPLIAELQRKYDAAYGIIRGLERENAGIKSSWDLLEAARLRLICENATLEAKLAAAEAALPEAKRLLNACVTRGDVIQKADARDAAIRFLARDRFPKSDAARGEKGK
jgi:hypothetical protein